jgi:Fe-Mn family superoxide dismutase
MPTQSGASAPRKSSAEFAPAPFETRRFDFSNVSGLSDRALDIHRSLYEGYVKETNALLPFVYSSDSVKDGSPAARLQRDGLIRRFAFEHNGMVLHELFFEALRGRSDPPRANGVFVRALERSYGSFEVWQSDVRSLAQTRGIGWVITMQSEDGRLSNEWIDEHSHGVLARSTPILAIDLWEHAYLIDYKPSERSQYLTTVFDNIDWKVVEARCV